MQKCGIQRSCFWLALSLWIVLSIDRTQLFAQTSPRVIAITPAIRYVGPHGTFRFRVVAAGRHLRYQWWHQEPDIQQGHPIPDNEGFSPRRPILTVPDAQPTRDYNGWYWCVVTDAVTGNSAQSSAAELIVVPPPTIVQEPGDAVVELGQPAAFSVEAIAHADVPKRFQWFFNTRAIPGATRSTLVIRNARPQRQGEYFCRVKTIGGATYSQSAYLRVVR